MIRSSIIGLTLSLTFSLAGLAQAPAAGKPAAPALPSVKDIQEKFITALGGRERLEKMKARVFKGKVQIPSIEASGPFELHQQKGGKFFQVVEFPEVGKIELGSDGTIVWEKSPQGIRLQQFDERLATLRDNDIALEVELDKHYPLVDCEGIEKVDGKDAYKVVMLSTDGASLTRFYDASSGLLVRATRTMKSPIGAYPVEIKYEDYREFEGAKFCCKQTQRILDKALEKLGAVLIVESVELPEEIDPARLEFPEDVKQFIEKRKAEAEAAAAERAAQQGAQPGGAPAPAPRP